MIASFLVPIQDGWIYLFVGLLIASSVFFITTLSRKHNEFQILLIVFVVPYVALWAMAAYGIVWYGILMYPLVIMIALYNIRQIQSYLSIGAVFFVFSWYMIVSVVPYNLGEFGSAGQVIYKANMMSANASTFQRHGGYIPVLALLNLKNEKLFLKDVFSSLANSRRSEDTALYSNILRFLPEGSNPLEQVPF